MRYIIDREPPPPMSDDDLKAMFPRSVEETVTATEEVMQAVRESRLLGTRIDELEDARKATSMVIKGFMGDNAKLVAPDGSVLATWRSAKDSVAVDWEQLAGDARGYVADPVWEKYLAAATTTKPGSRRFIIKEEK